MSSWRSTVGRLLIAILVVVIAFMIWTNAASYVQLREQALSADQSTVALWTRNTELRLNTVQEHIRELMITIYNNTSVFPGSAAMSLAVQTKCQTALDDKLNVSHDADCFFILNTETDWMLFSASATLRPSIGIIVGLKDYCQTHGADLSTGVTDREWSLVTINGEPCFFKSIALGKYAVGSICRVSSFDVSAFSGELYRNASLLLNADGHTVRIGGGVDLTEQVSFDGAQPRLRGSGTVVGADFSLIGGQTLLAKNQPLLVQSGLYFSCILLLASLLCIGLIVLLSVVINRRVVAPTAVLLEAQKQLREGNLRYRITDRPNSSEFVTIFDSFNSMADQIQHLRIESYDRLMTGQENRLRMVRAQIRPHFYLNAITTVSNMTYQNRPEDIRTYLQALAKYMRYMMNIQNQWITVGEELDHVGNYVTMQELRFPGSVRFRIECSDAGRQICIPFLILFTLVENSFKHALNLYKPLELTLRCTLEGRFCRISLEDNGDGFPQDVLEQFAAVAEAESLPPKEHLGLSNVRYTLQNIYKRGDLLCLSNTETGARAEILIPIEEDRNEAADL